MELIILAAPKTYRIDLFNIKTVTGANFTKTRLPVLLVYSEAFPRVEEAFKQQVKDWNRTKKEALIEGRLDELPKLSKKSK